MKDLDLYLSLERLMVDLDEAGDPIADRVRDLMDNVWYRLSTDDIARLDSRGDIDPSGLFPVRLPKPPPPDLPVATILDQQFAEPGWQAPEGWRTKKEAA